MAHRPPSGTARPTHVTPEPPPGREREDLLLRKLLHGLQLGRPALVDVHGPPGIGRSALLDHVITLADSYGVRVVAAHASREEIDLPHGIATQLHSALAATHRNPAAPTRPAKHPRRYGRRHWLTHSSPPPVSNRSSSSSTTSNGPIAPHCAASRHWHDGCRVPPDGAHLPQHRRALCPVRPDRAVPTGRRTHRGPAHPVPRPSPRRHRGTGRRQEPAHAGSLRGPGRTVYRGQPSTPACGRQPVRPA